MTDLDRYGLVALAVVILLILFVSWRDMEQELQNDGCLPVSLDREAPASAPDRSVAGAGEARAAPAVRDDFPFGEDPVSYPGGAVRETPAGSEPAAPEGGWLDHRVEKGESFASLAQAYFGTQAAWGTILAANPGLDPRKLKVGQVVRIPRSICPDPPERRASMPVAAAPVAAAPEDGGGARRHVVRKNETLAKIAVRYYGSERNWRRIYEANRKKISNPNMLRVGVELTIPR